jgi:hypothetical protein
MASEKMTLRELLLTETYEHHIETLEAELDAALRKIVELLVDSKSHNEAAWWLCANHPKFVLDQVQSTRSGRAAQLAHMASAAGPPPQGVSWPAWFERVSDLTNPE